MNRKDFLYATGFVLISVLLAANLFRPEPLGAFNLPANAGGQQTAISASGDSAWVIIGNKVYFLSLKNRSELSDRVIYMIDDQELK